MMDALKASQAQQAMDLQQVTRRHFFSQCSMGLGSIALGSLLGDGLVKAASVNPFQPGKPHFAPKAKNVIYMFMAGGPSQLELYDWKPELARRTGGDIPEEFIKGKRFAFMNSSFKDQKKLLGPVKKFHQHGQGGMWFSENIPHIGGIADEMTMFRTCKTNLFNHAPAKLFMNTGTGVFGRPSMGSWVTYGIGSESQSLPGFVVLHSGPRGPRGGAANWGSGFLPTTYQGVPLRGSGDPILNLANPAGVNRQRQRASIDTINKLNLKRLVATGDPEINTRIASYEMAYRMQASAPELIDISGESKATLDLYGIERGKPSFANNSLLARRLVQRGTRFVQLYHTNWDSHGGPGETLNKDFDKVTHDVDRASAALVKDLKAHGMLDDTLVIWGGEFGRTPMSEKGDGRDHNPTGFTMWMAGAGVKGGQVIGATDELGLWATQDRLHVHDLHATILHLLGLRDSELVYRYNGRPELPTISGGEAYTKITTG